MSIKKPKKSLTAFFIIAVLVVLVVGIALLWQIPHSSESSPIPQDNHTVQRRDLIVSVTESGNVKARNSVDIRSQVEGRTTIISIVPEGTQITEEDVKNKKVLVELDSSELTEDYTQKKITFATAEANYTEARETYEIQKKQNESDISEGELEVKFAHMDLQKYLGEILAREVLDSLQKNEKATPPEILSLTGDSRLGGSAYLQKTELESNIDLAKEKLTRAETRLAGTEKLFSAQYVAKAELEADQLAKKQREIELQQARLSRNLFLRYEFPKETEKLLSDYQEAQRQLERVKARARSKLDQARAKRLSAEATYVLQKNRLERLKKQIDSCVITATKPGMVVYGSSGDFYARRYRLIELGGDVRERQKIITIPDFSAMAVDIQVHESWVDKVEPNQVAIVTLDAFSDIKLTGKVLHVAPLPNPQSYWMDTGLKVYSTDVSIDGQHDFLKPGMSAKVQIIIKELKDVICVPLQAVANLPDGKVCYVLTTEGVREREIVTGDFNENFIEIIAGLQSGEIVSLLPSRWSVKQENKGSSLEQPSETQKPSPKTGNKEKK